VRFLTQQDSEPVHSRFVALDKLVIEHDHRLQVFCKTKSVKSGQLLAGTDRDPPGIPDRTGDDNALGIAAEVTGKAHSGYDYWALAKNGDFYSLGSLFEDERYQNSIFFNTRIVQITEALLYCKKLYSRLGFPLNSSVRMRITHGGLQGRVLTASGTRAFSMLFKDSTRENQVSTEIEFLLANVEADLIDLVKRLAEPLFLIFNFGHFEHQIYEQIITDFVAGKVT